MPKVKKDNSVIGLNTKISNIPSVGASLSKAFKTMKIETVSDLLYNFPTRYMDYRKKVNISQAQEGETITIVAHVKSVRVNFGFRGRVGYTDVTLEDGTGTIKAIWFNQTWVAKQLKSGDELIISGQVTRYKTLQLSNPAYEFLDKIEGEGLHTGRLVPIYKRSDLVPLRTLRKIIQQCLPAADDLEDFVPTKLQTKFKNIIPISKAVRSLHFPESEDDVSEAKFRIAIDDILPQQMAVLMHRDIEDQSQGLAIKANIDSVKAFLSTLPFALTPSQKRAAWDIFQDMESGKPMNRLLQGDVGSGKTIVAILAALQAAGSNLQTTVLAPTEILAKQHYDTFRFVLGSSDGIALLTRTFSYLGDEEISRAELAKKIQSGKVKICIGTHALLQGKTEFKKLGLVIIDEQHRFGVGQRSFLLGDSKNGNANGDEAAGGNGATNNAANKMARPHLLSMSATPIPRTLAMSLYADLAVSSLSHVPSGRKPVLTHIVPETQRQEAYDYIKNEVANGRQAFVVTPRVEETEASEVKSVKKEYERLQKEVFPKLKLGLLYGKMKGVDKDQVMSDFALGKINILVATSVIEIGIDIPNATAMIIEGSERFGLAQLHQLRGRIGRNDLQCRCFLFTTQDNHLETKRLNALAKINDGFKLAELDLEERGFGDLFGKEQSGFLFRFPKFITIKALTTARDIANELHKSKKISKTLKKIAESYLSDIHTE